MQNVSDSSKSSVVPEMGSAIRLSSQGNDISSFIGKLNNLFKPEITLEVAIKDAVSYVYATEGTITYITTEETDEEGNIITITTNDSEEVAEQYASDQAVASATNAANEAAAEAKYQADLARFAAELAARIAAIKATLNGAYMFNSGGATDMNVIVSGQTKYSKPEFWSREFSVGGLY